MTVRVVFADTVYWVAIASPRDEWATLARAVSLTLENTRIVTSDEVLIEFLNSISRRMALRIHGLRLVKVILDDPAIEVIPQSHESFLRGLDLFAARPDKGYSLTDCISMEIARNLGISQVLTADRHFEQEGFEILMRR